MTDTRARRRRSRARLVEQVLLAVALVALVAAVVMALVPVSNPGVQSCGSPIVFSWRSTNDVVLPLSGSPGAPPDRDRLAAQMPCHRRVDQRLELVGLAILLTVAAGLLGAALGIVDDRLELRSEPRFERYLRERPADAPSEPWHLPVVPADDLGRRLPDLEWREVRVILGAGLGASALLAWLGPWSEVRQVLGHLRLGWLALGLVLVAAAYPIWAATVLAATEGAPPVAVRSYRTVLATAVAGSFIGHLLPEYGSAGLEVHHLARAGDDRDRLARCMGASAWVSAGVHGALLVIVGVVAVGAKGTGGAAISWQWVVILGLVGALIAGMIGAPRRLSTLVVRPDRRSWRALTAMAADPLRLVGMVGGAAGIALLDGFVLAVVTRGVGATVATTTVIFVALAVSVLAVLAPTPAGAGVVEAATALGLIWAGMPGPAAVVAAVVARTLSFWLPLLPGWMVGRRLIAAGTI